MKNINLTKQTLFVAPNIHDIYTNQYNSVTDMKHIFGLNKVTKLENECFKNCSLLQELSFCEDVEIGVGCFENCISLTKLKLPHNNRKVKFVPTSEETQLLDKFGYKYDSVIFNSTATNGVAIFKEIEKCNFPVEISCDLSRMIFYRKELQKLKLPSNVTKIGNNFFGQNPICEIDLGNVKEVGDEIFGDHQISVTIPTTLTKIGQRIFDKCDRLQSVLMRGHRPFDGLISLDKMKYFGYLHVKFTNVEVPLNFIEKFKHKQDVKIALSMSTNDIDLSTFIMPNIVYSVGILCFHHFYKLNKIVFSSNLSSIRSNAFVNCVNLKIIELPQSLKSIENWAFTECGITKIDIPKSVTFVGECAFACCENLKLATFPENVFEEQNVFLKCFMLTNVNVVENDRKCSKINSIFKGCTSLKEIVMPNSATSLNYNSFSNCYSLSKIVIGQNTKKIRERCFENCSNLSEIEIPSSVTFIDDFSFHKCIKLQCVKFSKSVLNISPTAFFDCENLSTITVNGNKIEEIDFPVSYHVAQMFMKNLLKCNKIFFVKSDIQKYLKIVENDNTKSGIIPNGVVQLGEYCFKNYKKVDIINVPITVKRVDSFCFFNSIHKTKVIFKDKENVSFGNFFIIVFCRIQND
ncbi:hypothetical protein EIN_075990 [Entamoeba invadens IP1]|uniref:Leucine rich repeat containing protein BspA family protein n=1 Tax=Entamoeba invadens IP1 TaxID=370355 RepID=A0A0A1TW71_ENTIV|nr:hypothetical protein EIN_075990 [Entamoeba invadens IP1]ELP84790.1 hypothetical protein EIN_075990 [Entamoeba invadens IP1]|eukprot:XP_004184136.1 hypothetical protein EIN_075990 [Entamoeba invadens IP1]